MLPTLHNITHDKHIVLFEEPINTQSINVYLPNETIVGLSFSLDSKLKKDVLAERLGRIRAEHVFFLWG